jgi:phosphate acetyltransferase
MHKVSITLEEPYMLDEIIKTLKANRRKIVFTEGEDPRILEAATRLVADGIMDVLLCGDPEKVKAAAAAGGFKLDGIEIADPKNYPGMDIMVETMVDLRKGKMTAEECRAALQKGNYFGTMLVKMGKADGLLGGATYSTADTVRPALQIVKTKPGNKLVSSCFIMYRETEKGVEKYAMADCAININPDEDGLAEIAVETARTARVFGIDPKVAMLSYSTKGSGKGESVDMMRNATEKVKAMNPDFEIDGELQFDAAFSPVVAATKAKDSSVAGKANTFIFPDINAGNIGYKIAQRLGGFEAYGPILQGLNAPINDLSRGCNADEVYAMAIITLGTI